MGLEYITDPTRHVEFGTGRVQITFKQSEEVIDPDFFNEVISNLAKPIPDSLSCFSCFSQIGKHEEYRTISIHIEFIFIFYFQNQIFYFTV